MGELKKQCCNKKNGVGWDIVQKLLVQLDFQKKFFFLEIVAFHHKVLNLTNFKLVLGVYIVHVVIFINKY